MKFENIITLGMVSALIIGILLGVVGTLQTDGYTSADGSQGWTGNCVNASYKDGIVVGCND